MTLDTYVINVMSSDASTHYRGSMSQKRNFNNYKCAK